MAESQSKRLREESNEQVFELEDSNSKRNKSYDNILSILDEEPEQNEPNQELSAIFSTFQQELTGDPLACTASEAEQDHHPSAAATTTSGGGECSPKEEEEDDSIKVIRHLLEASDDELGIPNTNNRVDEEINYGNYNTFAASFDGFWELEDEAANYYTVLQSELFM
uniref:Putative LisH domain-containing protein C1711.05-like protein n=1 Tax=Olea europaea subsp. europaea TaxID=158383 RepID=A0A1B1V5E9_OLEEU|nr:putative LisH domain-containing protein C1711.05-like protein [Olea europaea subsp. europaea]